MVALPGPVGDVVMATPTLRALRRGCPDAQILYYGKFAALATLAGTDWADSMVPYHRGGTLAAAKRLRQCGCDAAILFPNSFRAALTVFLAGIGERIGYDRDGRTLLLTRRLQARRSGGTFLPVPQMRYYARLLEPLGIQPDEFRMELPVTAEHEQQAEDLLARAPAGDGPTVMINPGCAFGPSKQWNLERFAELADMLAERDGARIVINAAPNEKQIAARVVHQMRTPPAVSFHDRDNTLGLLKSLVKRCDLMVTNDTGPRHFAAAFDVPVVTLFGSTDPVWAQIDYPGETILRKAVHCSPCQQKLCPQPLGPMYHRCMFAIKVQEVYQAALARLAERRRPAEVAR